MVESIRQEENKDVSSILRSDLFLKLLPREERAVLDHTENMLLRKDALLFSPGEKAEHLYMLLEGFIRVFKPVQENEKDRNNEVARFAPGDIIGDFDFARGETYDAFAEALEDSLLVMFPGFGSTLEKFAEEEPLINSKILFNAAAMITGRIKSTRKLITESVYWVKELRRQMYEDPSTGLWKMTLIDEEINELLENPMTLIMLKPDHFKILVDALGHDAGDEAMIKIASVLKKITRRLGRGWALRFKSNETGLLLNKCDPVLAESLAFSLSGSISALPSVSLGNEEFSFSASVAWGVWPVDDKSWDSLYDGVTRLLAETWQAGGKKVARYIRE
jgi:diguanylate cyclase (GGDEF)-like protein